MKINACLFCIFIIIIIGCTKKNRNINYSGISFYPTEKVKLHSADLYDLGINNDFLNLTYQKYDTQFCGGVLSYVFSSGKYTDSKNFLITDTTDFIGIVPCGSDKFIGIASDRTKPFLFRNKSWVPDKLMLLDNTFHPLKQVFLNDTINNYYFLRALKNGKFIALWRSASLDTSYLVCFDETLNIVWKTSILEVQPPNYSLYPGLIVTDNGIYLLEFIYASDNRVRIQKYDYTGKRIKTTAGYDPGINSPKITVSKLGVTVMGFVTTPNKRFEFSFNHFDPDANFISKTNFDTRSFSSSNTFQTYISSNIINLNDNTYFTVNIDNYTSQNLKTTEAKLVKLNDKFELTWIKTIDKNRLISENSQLQYSAGHLLIAGKSIWNGLAGISFIRTDLDGNIIE